MRINEEQIGSLNRLILDSLESEANIDLDDILAPEKTLLVNIGVDKYKIEPSGHILMQDWSEVNIGE